MSVEAVSFATPVSDVVPGRVFWLTGLSGAGKTTIGRLLWSRLRASGAAAVFLDGDTLRQIVSQDLGYDRGDRHSSAMRNSLTCRLLADQGLDVVCATISLFHDVQQWNRTHIPRYFEIFIHAPRSELERRDSKGIYAARRPGPAANVVGIDIEPELPREPDLILDNTGSLDLDQAVTLILEHTSDLQKLGRRQTSQRTVQFGTKAETLEHLARVLKGATVLPQIRFSVAQWCTDRCGIIERIAAAPWGLEKLIVRSSAKAEDGAAESLAGKYTSISAVKGATQVAQAITGSLLHLICNAVRTRYLSSLCWSQLPLQESQSTVILGPADRHLSSIMTISPVELIWLRLGTGRETLKPFFASNHAICILLNTSCQL